MAQEIRITTPTKIKNKNTGEITTINEGGYNPDMWTVVGPAGGSPPATPAPPVVPTSGASSGQAYINASGAVVVPRDMAEEASFKTLGFQLAPTVPERTSNPLQTAESNYIFGLDTTPMTPEEEAAIKESTRQALQVQLDAIDAETARRISAENLAGKGREGMTRAIGSRSGLLGSPMGLAQEEKTKGFTKQNIDIIGEEQNQKKLAIFDKIDQRAMEEIRLKKVEISGNIDKYFTYLKGVQTEARSDAATLAKTGQSLDLLKANKQYYDQLLAETGQSQFEFDTLWNANSDAARKIDYTYTWKGDNLVAIGVDPITKQLKTNTYTGSELGIPKGVDFGTIVNELSGEVYWYDKSSTNPTLNRMGNAGIMKTPGGNLTEAEKLENAAKAMTAQLSIPESEGGPRGTDSYISPESWKKAKDAWASEGFQPEDFIRQFYIYINPTHSADYGTREDSYLKSDPIQQWIQQQIQKGR